MPSVLYLFLCSRVLKSCYSLSSGAACTLKRLPQHLNRRKVRPRNSVLILEKNKQLVQQLSAFFRGSSLNSDSTYSNLVAIIKLSFSKVIIKGNNASGANAWCFVSPTCMNPIQWNALRTGNVLFKQSFHQERQDQTFFFLICLYSDN